MPVACPTRQPTGATHGHSRVLMVPFPIAASRQCEEADELVIIQVFCRIVELVVSETERSHQLARPHPQGVGETERKW